MEIKRTPDKVILTNIEVIDIIAKHVYNETGRRIDPESVGFNYRHKIRDRDQDIELNAMTMNLEEDRPMSPGPKKDHRDPIDLGC